MDSTMDLPPPAPPDAFSLGDEDSVPFGGDSQHSQAGATASTAVVSTQPPAAGFAESEQQHHTKPAILSHHQQLGKADTASGSSGAGQSTQSAPEKPQAPQQQQHASSTAPAGPEKQSKDPTPPPTKTPQHEQQPLQAPQQDPATQGLHSQWDFSNHEEQQHPQQSDHSSQQGTSSLAEQQQQQPQQSRHSRLQPQDLTSLLGQLSDNAEAIAAAEEVLEGLLLRQATLHQLGRKMEQHQVLCVLQRGHLGFDKGRPVAAVLLYRCLLHWGLLHQTEQCPFLEQLAAVLQSQLDLEDASAPADVAGLQCHVANSLTLCAVLYCVLLKAGHPQLAAAAAAQRSAPRQLHTAAEVVAAARKKVSATWQQSVAHMGPGLQALGKLKLGGWGFKRSDDSAATAAGAGAIPSSSSSHMAPGSAEHPDMAQSGGSSSSSTVPPAHSADPATAAHTAAEQGGTAKAADAAAATAAESSAAAAAGAEGGGSGGLHAAAPFDGFLLCLDQLVQHSYSLLRDQLKRRLTPLLADCISPENNVMTAAVGDSSDEQPLSPNAGGAAVAGSTAESAAHAEAELMNYRSWSELVGVLHAALVALRSAHVPRALRATLMQQVLEFVNCQLFNQLLLRPECCSVSNARYALRGLKQLDTWIVAEQSASHHSGRSSHQPHAVTGAGSIHTGGISISSNSGSFNSQTPVEASAASKLGGSSSSATAVAAAGASKLGGSGSSSAVVDPPGGDGSGGGLGVGQPAVVEEDGGWEQVPADTGEFDSWQPHKQQQQQHWWRLQRQQQEQPGAPGEQPELGPEAWNALAHVRQALQFLVLDSKGALSLEDLTDHVCPALNHQQLYRLCTTAWTEAPDAADGGGGGVSGEVLEQMKQLYTLSGNGGLIVTFLLDEPTGPLPFTQQLQQQPAAVAAGGSSGSAARCRLSCVVAWDDGRDYGVGLRPVPGVLVGEGCPAEVFEFLTRDQAWPPGRHGAS